MELGLRAMAAAVAVLTGIGAGISTGLATGKAVESVSRQPEASSKIITVLVIGSAFAEATAIYGLLVAILLIFVGLT
ncbi:MAG: ATP synthase F0 subunit C [Clostridiaceae bacterium]